MATRIQKRDGRSVKFDLNKISKAIGKAMSACEMEDETLAVKLALEVESRLSKTKPTVEQVQDAVETVLIQNQLAAVAKTYILYRAERTRVRELDSRIMRELKDLTFKSAAESETKRENANIDGDTAMGTMLKYGSESAKAFYKMSVLSPVHSEMHDSGDIHIHDLDFLTLTTTCCQIDLAKLFKGGFCTGHGFLREPNSIAAYSSLACIAIQSNQNDQHGGQSIPKFDYDLAPGVAKTYVKVYRDNLQKAVELMVEGDHQALLDSVF
ncbi:MAG: ATP cone domain-containing protein, partial [Firmicutes bacterium]|nr:ATP cone domain-containing protein [Bacillota bacterium]